MAPDRVHAFGQLAITDWTSFGVTRPFRLWSIRFSHYAEKVRWTLDLYGLPYIETPLMPVAHFLVTPLVIGPRGYGDSHSTRFSTPIVRTDKGERLIKSSAIMRYVSDRFAGAGKPAHLYPSAEVAALDEHYNNRLGPHTRRLFYAEALNRPDLMFALADKNVPMAHALLFKAMFALLRRKIISGLRITQESVERGIGYIRAEFDAVARRLRDGRPFLFGDRLSAADISFACLGGAALLPQPHEGFAAQLPDEGCGCERLVDLSRELRQSEAGAWVLRLYREHRGKRLIEARPPLQPRAASDLQSPMHSTQAS